MIDSFLQRQHYSF